MNCHACGHNAPSSFIFCPSCGTRPLNLPPRSVREASSSDDAWSADEDDRAATERLGSSNQDALNWKPPRSKATLWVAAAGVLLVIVGLVVAL